METNGELKAHAAADAVPEMSDDEYQALKKDIAENGLLEKIVLYSGQILDGRHRYRACKEQKIEPKFEDYHGEDLIGFVISKNVTRRHLKPSQRAMLAAKLVDRKRGGDRTKAQNCALTLAQAARMIGVSERSVDTASALLNGVAAGIVDAAIVTSVERGEISLAKADRVLRLPKEEQLAAAAHHDRCRATQTRPPQWERQLRASERGFRASLDRMESIVSRARHRNKHTAERKEKIRSALLLMKERVENLSRYNELDR